VMNFN